MTGTLAPAASPPGALVRFSGVGKLFANGVEALAGLDLSIAPGEFLALLGPSGCGKSTALRLLAGLADPSRGSIDWPSAVDPTARAHRRDIGFVFQEPTLMPWATVFGNVWLPLRLLGVSKSAATPAVREALALVGLAEFERAYPRELSGGMKMRVSIARALVTKPALLLMDEPFAALDEITRFKLNNDLLRIWRDMRCTVVFVTHSVFESVYLATRVVVMAPRPGRIVEDIAIEGPAVRDERFRTSPDYAAQCRRVSGALAHAMGEEAAA